MQWSIPNSKYYRLNVPQLQAQEDLEFDVE